MGPAADENKGQGGHLLLRVPGLELWSKKDKGVAEQLV